MEVSHPAKTGTMKLNQSAETAFRRLYESHYTEVLAYCRRRTGRADAHDATSEVFLIAWRKIDDLPDADKVRAWLFGIAYRVLGHQWRSRYRYGRLKRRMAGTAHTAEPGPERVVVRRAEDRRVLEAVRRLRPADQEILRLAGWEEMPHADIAVILGISVAAVDQRFHRAKQRLASEYDKAGAGDERGGAE
jgi:RNA polymerase sigma-70 factor (ECF subfamily)